MVRLFSMQKDVYERQKAADVARRERKHAKYLAYQKEYRNKHKQQINSYE